MQYAVMQALKKGVAEQSVQQRGSNYRSNWIFRLVNTVHRRRIDLALKEVQGSLRVLEK